MTRYTEYLKCEFSDTEIADAAKELARSAQKKASIEQRKKEIDASLKADIEAENSSIARLSSMITTGYEYRDVECRVELDTPEPGKKRIIRLDDGCEVKVLNMTDKDRQIALDLQEKAEEADEAKTQEPIVTPPPDVKCIAAGDVA